MAKLRPDSITAKDLEDFVANNSDFAFEMKVPAQLRNLEFDIRATKEQNMCTLRLAVGRKNLLSVAVERSSSNLCGIVS